MDTSLISHFLPIGLLDHFSITSFEELEDTVTKEKYLEKSLEENNVLLRADASEYESKGFTEIRLQDFPIRGKALYLRIKRRRWRHKLDSKIVVRNDFSFVAAGSGFTQELSDFLKCTGKYKG
jgi:hypothetical protein